MSLGRDDWVLEDPAQLAASADVNINTYSLARAIASEAVSEPYKVKRAIGFAIRNEALRRGVSLFALVTTTRQKGAAYRYGAQYHPESGDSRYVSTARAPRAEDLDLAKKILSGRAGSDPTAGASRFFQPGLQDRLVAEGRPGYRSTAKELLATWAGEGWRVASSTGSWTFLRHEAFQPYLAGIALPGAKAAAMLTLIGAAALVAYVYAKES